MNNNFNDNFDLDKILAEVKSKKNINTTSFDVNKPNKTNDIQAKKLIDDDFNDGEKINNIDNKEKFNLNIDFNNKDIFSIDDNLLYQDEDIDEDSNVLKNFFKKENRIKYNLYDDDNIKKEEKQEELTKLNDDEVLKILKSNKKYLMNRTLLLIVSTMLSFSSVIFNLNDFFGVINLSAIVNLLAVLVATFACSDIVMNGLKCLFKNKGSFTCLTSLLCFCSMVQCCFGVVNGELNTLACIYTPSVILILFFDIFARWYLYKNMKINSRFMVSENNKLEVSYAYFNNILNPNQESIACFSNAQVEKPMLCYSNMNYGQQINSFFMYGLLGLALATSVVSYFVTKNLYFSVSALNCLLIVFLPLSTDFCYKFIFNRLAKKLYKNKSILYKYSAIEKIKSCENLIINNTDFLNEGSFKLIKMKIFDYNQINASIIDIASILNKANSMLSKMFLNIIGNKLQLLKDVTSIEESDNLGITGKIDEDEIIFGISDYILDNNIVIPSKYLKLTDEMKEDKSLKILYVAINGMLTAMFLIKMEPVSEITNILKYINKNDLKITLALKDPFITTENISYIYNINKSYINAISSQELRNASANTLGIIHDGKTNSLITSISECLKINHIMNITSLLQIISIILGFCLISTFILLNSLSLITASGLIVLQLFWLLIIFIFPNLHK